MRGKQSRGGDTRPRLDPPGAAGMRLLLLLKENGLGGGLGSLRARPAGWELSLGSWVGLGVIWRLLQSCVLMERQPPTQASEEALLCGRTLGLGPVLCHLEPCVAGHPGFCSHLAWPSPLGPSTASRHHPCTLAPGLPVPWLAFRAGLGELLLARPASDPQLQALPFGEPYTPSFLGGPGLLRGPLCNFVNPRLVG